MSSKLLSTRIPRCISSRSACQTTRRASWSGCRRQPKLLQGKLGRYGTTSTLSDCLAHVWPRAAYILWVRPAKLHGTHKLHGVVTRVGASRKPRCTCVGLLFQPRKQTSPKSRRSFFCFRAITKWCNSMPRHLCFELNISISKSACKSGLTHFVDRTKLRGCRLGKTLLPPRSVEQSDLSDPIKTNTGSIR